MQPNLHNENTLLGTLFWFPHLNESEGKSKFLKILHQFGYGPYYILPDLVVTDMLFPLSLGSL